MALASLDLRRKAADDDEDPREARTVPADVEAEQGVLGAMLFQNEAVDLVADILQPHHFYEPFHGRLYSAIVSLVRRGRPADPTLLAEQFRADSAYKELGGVRYLANLVDRAPPAAQAADYANHVVDLALRRQMMVIAAEMSAAAANQFSDDETGERIDAVTIAAEFERKMTEAQVSSARLELTSIEDSVAGVLAYVEDPEPKTGVLTGLAPLDLQVGPWFPGDLVLAAARPGMGKSALSLAIAIGVADPMLADFLNEREGPPKQGKGVIQFHGEMQWTGQVGRRHLSDVGFAMFGETFPSYKDIRDRKIGMHELGMLRAAEERFHGVPITGLKRSGLKISQMRSLARRQFMAWKRAGIEPGLILIDHAGLVRPEGRTTSRYEAQSQISQGFKELADELEVPVLVLVQMSRDVEKRDNKQPQLADLRDSGRWEEDADVVIMLHRDSYYALREPEPPVANQLEYDKWDRRRKSKEVTALLPKLREGEGGGNASLWGGMKWNAIRGAEPQRHGGML